MSQTIKNTGANPGPLVILKEEIIQESHTQGATPQLTPQFVRPGQCECLELPGEVRHQILDGSDTNGQFALARTKIEAGRGPAPHVLTREDELFFIESGEFLFSLGDQTYHIATGDFLFVPRHVVRSYTCLSDEGSELLTFTLGAGYENLFRELAARLERGEHYTQAEMRAIALNYGVHFEDFEELEPPTQQSALVRASEGECLQAFGDKVRLLVGTSTVEGRYCLAENQTPPLGGPPLHRHLQDDETFVILSGRYEFQIADARIQAGVRDVVFAPHGIPHTFRVVSNEPGSFLVLVMPGGFDNFFRSAARLFSSGEATPQRLVELGEQHSIEFLPPDA